MYFTAFGEALIWSLQQQFGPAFTPEMEQAWIELYDAIQTENDACRKNASLARRLLVKVGRHDAHGRGRLLRDV